MRVPDNVLAEITDKLGIAEVVGEYVTLRSQGARLVGLCPFHNEKTPSFSVTPDKGLFYCFGCHKGGNLFTFVMEMEKVPFGEAVALLAEKAGVSYDLQTAPADLHQSALRELYDRVAGSFHFILKESVGGEPGRRYLEERGISIETIEKFRVGFAPSQRNWLYDFLRKKNYSEGFLATSGLFSSRFPRVSLFSNRIMFPIVTQSGSTVAFGGRALSDNGPKYINSPETEIFHKGEQLYGLFQALPTIRKESHFIIVEGYFDVLAMHQAGIFSAVAPLGTAFTVQQARKLRRYTERGILFFDGDAAGVSAAKKSVLVSERAGIRVDIVGVEPGMDPADILKNQGPDALHKLAKYPISSFDYLLEKARERYDEHSPEGKEAIIREFFPFIDIIDSEVRKETYVTHLSDALGVDSGAILRDFSRFDGGNNAESGIAPREVDPATTQDLYLLLALSVNREFFSFVRTRLSIEDIEDPRGRELFIALEECYRKGDKSTDCLLDAIENPRLRELVIEKLSSDEFGLNQEEYVRSTVIRLKARSLERKKSEVDIRLKQAQASGKPEDEIRELMLDVMFLNAELQKLKVNEND
jgi:DNA primase